VKRKKKSFPESTSEKGRAADSKKKERASTTRRKEEKGVVLLLSSRKGCLHRADEENRRRLDACAKEKQPCDRWAHSVSIDGAAKGKGGAVFIVMRGEERFFGMEGSSARIVPRKGEGGVRAGTYSFSKKGGFLKMFCAPWEGRVELSPGT